MHRLVHIVRFESARRLTKVPKEHPCSNLYGLAFKLEIHIQGEMNKESGFVLDFNEIEKSFSPIYKLIDHNYLNEIEGLENPTSENLALWIWGKLKPQLPLLSTIEIKETCTSGCVYSGES